MLALFKSLHNQGSNVILFNHDKNVLVYKSVAEIAEKIADAVSLLMEEAVRSQRQKVTLVCGKLLEVLKQSVSNLREAISQEV